LKYFNITLFLTLGIFMTACGGESNTTTPTTQESSNKVEVGEDKRVKVNESVILTAKRISNIEKVSSLLWTYQGNTLATTRSFNYVPTTVGVKTLTFSALYNDGEKVSDTLKVVVTSKKIDTKIPAISETLKNEYLKAVNNARSEPQDCGEAGSFAATTKLTWNSKLYEAAYEHMQDLIESKTFEHEGSGTESDWTGYALGKKSDFVERIVNHGYKWSRLAENLGGGTHLTQPEEMVREWLESDHHCANLMNPNFTEVGMVMLKDDEAKYTHYWGQEFGTPK